MLQAALLEFFRQQGMAGKTYWIAYSGGLDSHVLLSLCHRLRQDYPIELRVIHVNHQLHPQAADWAAHCRQVAANYQIDYVEKIISLDDRKGESLEALARERRYAVLSAALGEGDCLLTAHQQDDQAETMLVQLLRGAGPKGLASMPSMKPLGRGVHARPLLGVTRAALSVYAKEQGLQWIEDESNSNTQFTRNFIRQNVMPLLRTRFPDVTQALARSAVHCAESDALLEEYAVSLGSNSTYISISSLLVLSPAQQGLVLRAWIRQQGVILPDTKKIDIIRQEVLLADANAMPCVAWGDVELRRYRDKLYLRQRRSTVPLINVDWDLSQPLPLSGRGVLSTRSIRGQGLRLDISPVSVRSRQGGETIRIIGRGRQTLKNLFQEWGVPPWERAEEILLFVAEECVGVVGRCMAEGYSVKSTEMGRWPHLERA